MSDIFERAAAYIRQQGDEFDRVRLAKLDDNTGYLTNEQQARFFAGQRADGGWAPFWAPDYSSLDATCYRLAQAAGLWIRPSSSSEIHGALDFLRSRQRPDGSWEEDASVADRAPPWARPGELASRLYLTANCGWTIADSGGGGFGDVSPAAQRAGDCLAAQVAPDGSFPAFLQIHWLAAGLWIRAGQDDLAYRTLDTLANRLDANVGSGALAWMLFTLGGLGIPADHPIGQKGSSLLLAQQRADGGWASEDGPDRDPAVTVEALHGLLKWAAI